MLNIEFISEEPIAESVELDGVIIDYSKDRRIVAIEILDAGKRTTKDPLDFINLLIPKTGHYTYNYLKTLEIVFNMGEWQIW